MSAGAREARLSGARALARPVRPPPRERLRGRSILAVGQDEVHQLAKPRPLTTRAKCRDQKKPRRSGAQVANEYARCAAQQLSPRRQRQIISCAAYKPIVARIGIELIARTPHRPMHCAIGCGYLSLQLAWRG